MLRVVMLRMPSMPVPMPVPVPVPMTKLGRLATSIIKIMRNFILILAIAIFDFNDDLLRECDDLPMPIDYVELIKIIGIHELNWEV